MNEDSFRQSRIDGLVDTTKFVEGFKGRGFAAHVQQAGRRFGEPPLDAPNGVYRRWLHRNDRPALSFTWILIVAFAAAVLVFGTLAVITTNAPAALNSGRNWKDAARPAIAKDMYYHPGRYIPSIGFMDEDGCVDALHVYAVDSRDLAGLSTSGVETGEAGDYNLKYRNTADGYVANHLRCWNGMYFQWIHRFLLPSTQQQ